MWIKFLTDDSAPHESKHTQIHVSLQEHRRRFLISSSHSFWWKAAQVTDFCHFSETNIWFDSTIGWFLCVCVFPFSLWHRGSQPWSNDTPESVSRLWPHHSRRRAVSPIPRKKKLLQRRESLQTRFQHHICHQTKEANSHILYVKTQYGSKLTFYFYILLSKIWTKFPDLKNEANAKVL